MITMLGKVWHLWFCNDGYPCLRVRPQLSTYRIRGCDLHTELQGGLYIYTFKIFSDHQLLCSMNGKPFRKFKPGIHCNLCYPKFSRTRTQKSPKGSGGDLSTRLGDTGGLMPKERLICHGSWGCMTILIHTARPWRYGPLGMVEGTTNNIQGKL